VTRLHLDEEQWRSVMPLLGQALELDDAERSALLTRLEWNDPAVARALRTLLGQLADIKAANFLEDAVIAPVPHESLAGQTIGAYTIEALIGRGGMGEVWRAHRSDGRFERKVAVKVMHASLLSKRAGERFAQEGRVVARLTHPNIATLVDAGITAESRPYIVLEHVEGESIDRYCDSQSFGTEERLRLFLDVVAAVAHAQSNLVVHRDLKPSNVLVTRDGVVKLLDFGIAKLLDSGYEGEGTEPTRIGELALTPEYAAPEQLVGEPVSAATDVYQLGVLLYVLLSGCLPFPRPESRRELVRMVLDTEPPRMSDRIGRSDRRLRATLGGDLDAIVAKALRRDVNERYSSAAMLAEDLHRYLRHEPVAAREGAFRYRAGKFVRRYRRTLLSAGVVGVGLIATTVFALMQMREAQIQRDDARFQAQRAGAERRFTTLMMGEIDRGGRPASLEEIIDKGVVLLEKQYSHDPAFVVDMLISLSGRYMDLGKRHKEHAVLVKAARIARWLGPAALANVQCNTVETEIALGDLPAAAARLREGAAALASIPEPDFHHVVDCHHAQASVSEAEGRLEEAIRHAELAAGILEKENDVDGIRYSALLSHITVMYDASGNPARAAAVNRRAQVALERSGRAGTVQMQTARHNEAAYLAEMGQVREGLSLQREVIEHLTATAGDVPPVATTTLYGALLLRMENPAEALRWLDASVQEAQAEGSQRRQIVAGTLRSAALLALGRSEEAWARLPDLASLKEAPDIASRRARVRVEIVRADMLLASHRNTAAREEIDEVLAEIASANSLSRLEPYAYLTAARIAMAEGRVADASRYAGDALRIFERRAAMAARSADVGEALLILATVRKSSGDSQAAQHFARRAHTALSHGLGSEHSLTRAAALVAP
jgi:tetratricopeptide (TPR) repeat protein